MNNHYSVASNLKNMDLEDILQMESNPHRLLEIACELGRLAKQSNRHYEVENLLKKEVRILDNIAGSVNETQRKLRLLSAYGQLGRTYKQTKETQSAIKYKLLEVELLENLEGKFDEEQRLVQLRYTCSYLGNLYRKVSYEKAVYWTEREKELLELIKPGMLENKWNEEYLYCIGRLSGLYKKRDWKKALGFKWTELQLLEKLEGQMNETKRCELISETYITMGLYEKTDSVKNLKLAIEYATPVLETGFASDKFIENCKMCANELFNKDTDSEDIVSEFECLINNCEQNRY